MWCVLILLSWSYIRCLFLPYVPLTRRLSGCLYASPFFCRNCLADGESCRVCVFNLYKTIMPPSVWVILFYSIEYRLWCIPKVNNIHDEFLELSSGAVGGSGKSLSNSRLRFTSQNTYEYGTSVCLSSIYPREVVQIMHLLLGWNPYSVPSSLQSLKATKRVGTFDTQKIVVII